MTDPHGSPTTDGLDALLDAVAAWYEAGAATTPRRVAAVERTRGFDSVVRDTVGVLASAGVLEPVGEAYRLTDAGADLGAALVVGDDRRARRAARSVLRELSVDDFAALADRLLNDGFPHVSTALDLFEWASGPAEAASGRPGSPRQSVLIGDGSGDQGRVQTGRQPLQGSGQYGYPSLQTGAVPASQQGSPRPQPPQQGPPQQGLPQEQSPQPHPSEQVQQSTSPSGEATQRQSRSAGDHSSQQGASAGTGQSPADDAAQQEALWVQLSVDNLELEIDGNANKIEEIVSSIRRGLASQDGRGP